MNILAFDTCFGAVSVAAGSTDGRDGLRMAALFEARATGHAEALMPMVARVMDEARLRFDALDRIAVTVGPGSFTGTRIGIGAARAFRLVTGATLAGTSSLAVMAEQVFAARVASGQGLAGVLVAVDARRGQVYAQLFGEDALDAKSPPLLLTAEAAARLAGSHSVVVAGSGAAAVAEAATQLGRQLRVLLPDLEPDARALFRLAPRLESLGAAAEPLYLRPPDAKPQDGKSLVGTL